MFNNLVMCAAKTMAPYFAALISANRWFLDTEVGTFRGDSSFALVSQVVQHRRATGLGGYVGENRNRFPLSRLRPARF